MSLSRRTPVLVGVLGVLTIVLGLVVLLGWVTGQEVLTRLLPDLVAMQPATAVDFVLLGVATLVVNCTWARDRVPVAVAWVAVGLVVAIAGTGLVTEFTHHPYPFAFLGDMEQNGGRMSGITAVGHLLLSASVVAMALGRAVLAHGTGLTALALGLMGLSGYAFGPSDLYSVGYFQTLALHTAIGITMLGLAAVAASGEVGLTRLARSRTLGGRLTRTLLPAVLVVPTVLGWVGVWMMRNGSSPGFVMALYATTVAALSGVLVWSTGSRLTAADVRRHEAEQARTEADQALAELQVASADLRIANRDLRDFTAAAAHDLRGPLSAVMLGLQMLEDDDGEATRNHVVRRVTGAAERGMTLIDDLLEYGEVGTVDVELSPVDLEAVVKDVVAQIEEASGRRVSLAAGPWSPVAADERLVRRLLVNLVGNAVKYTPGEQDVDLQVGTQRLPDGRVRLWVADRGLPIPDDERELVFEIFKRGAQGARHAGGTGVGLAVSRRIVERHGGDIEVVDHSGWSKRFQLTLPGAGQAPRPSSASARSTASA